ncbi:DNA kinase/phosphatase Pnk1 [Astrocystis sublimbata]|nr:DNA kinase/phosphatase Pnk1 [Astrocystis sublimbata]
MAPPEIEKETAKRKASLSRPISPPPVKRKAHSAISQGAVASFFTPTSQKPKVKERTVWTERGEGEGVPTLLVGRYEPGSGGEGENEGKETEEEVKRTKIAAFDLDSTLIVTASGKKFGSDAVDWKWWDPSVPARLRKLYAEEGYRVVILSNQAGLTLHPDPTTKAPPKNAGKAKVATFKQKAAAVLQHLDIPTTLYAATAHDLFRKPRVGMWREVCVDYDILSEAIDLKGSVFVGDAGGRTAKVLIGGEYGKERRMAKDFSCSDRNFAYNVGIKYLTPEEFFLGEGPREFVRDFDLEGFPYGGGGDGGEGKAGEEGKAEKEILFEKTNTQDVVLFCGPPGAGKSTFFWKYLKPLGYERVNQDLLKTRPKCLKAAAEFLGDGCSVVVDNTNPDPDVRKEWVDLARKHDVPIRCVWFKIPKAVCEHNNVSRALNQSLNPEARTVLPPIAFNGYFSRLREPTVKEGFQDVVPVEFKFRGSREEYEVWGRYWV